MSEAEVARDLHAAVTKGQDGVKRVIGIDKLAVASIPVPDFEDGATQEFDGAFWPTPVHELQERHNFAAVRLAGVLGFLAIYASPGDAGDGEEADFDPVVELRASLRGKRFAGPAHETIARRLLVRVESHG